MHDTSDLKGLEALRWAVRATVLTTVAVSTAANILHAPDNTISQAISAWPPLALLLTVELITRIPTANRWLAALRTVAATGIAGIAAWISYWHMVGVAARYGETGGNQYLLPLTVDGLAIVASVCLYELSARIRRIKATGGEDAPPPAQAPAPAPTAPAVSVVPSIATLALTDPADPDVPAEPAARPVAKPADYARQVREHPEWTQKQHAAKLGVGERTLRTDRWQAALQDA